MTLLVMYLFSTFPAFLFLVTFASLFPLLAFWALFRPAPANKMTHHKSQV